MKNKIVWSMALSILIFAIFMGKMAQLKDDGTFYLEDLKGQREYLNLFPMAGVAGDGTQGLIFCLEDGELSTQHYPFELDQVRNIFFAKREGITGLKKYSYDYYNSLYLSDVSCFADAAPAEDAVVEHSDTLPEEAVEKGYFDYEEFQKTETIEADKIDVYLDFYEHKSGLQARVRTGMTMEDQSYYFTGGYSEEGDISSLYSSFNDVGVQGFSVKQGDAYYAMIASNTACQGETAIYRLSKEGLVTRDSLNQVREFYQQNEYGEAEEICSFPVNGENRVFAMFAVGDHALGVFRIENEELLFETYDLNGKLTGKDLLSTELSSRVDEIETHVVVWDEGDASVYFKMYEVVEKDDSSEVWTSVMEGLYQFDEKGLKKLNCCEQGAKLLSVCRSNLVLDVSMVFDEGGNIPYDYGYEVYLTVINGDTGKMLYQGRIKTDYAEDRFKNFSIFNTAKRAPYIEEAVKKQYLDSIIVQRQRQISDIVPINGRGESLWWR